MKSLIILLTFHLSAAADTPFCEDRYLNKTEKPRQSDAPYCEQFKNNAPFILQNHPDGTKHLNCVHTLNFPDDMQAEFKKIEPELPARTARARAFFEELKTSYKQVVDKSENGFLMNKLDGLTLTFKKCTPKEAMHAQLLLIANTIQMCEQLLLLSREALLTHLNHEIAHVTDPCLYVVIAELTFPQYEITERFEQCFGKAEGHSLAVKFTEGQIIGGQNFSSGRRFAPNSTGQATYQKMKSCGMVKETETINPPSHTKNHPFADLFQCTYKGYDVAQMNYAPKVDGAGFDTALTRPTRIPNASCTVEGKEVYAEAVGSFMSAQYLRAHPPRSGYEASVMFMKDFMTCALNNPSGLHVAANKGMMLALQYEPFQKIAGCKLKAKPDVCGRADAGTGGAGGNSGANR